jgi:hypothetical protein
MGTKFEVGDLLEEQLSDVKYHYLVLEINENPDDASERIYRVMDTSTGYVESLWCAWVEESFIKLNDD